MYLWEREGAAGDESARTSGLSTPASPAIAPAPQSTFSPTTYSSGGTRGPTIPNRESRPAYLPPRAFTRASSAAGSNNGTTTTTVRPLKVLAGHTGTVFDVRARAGTMLSAGQDGIVGVWE